MNDDEPYKIKGEMPGSDCGQGTLIEIYKYKGYIGGEKVVIVANNAGRAELNYLQAAALGRHLLKLSEELKEK